MRFAPFAIILLLSACGQAETQKPKIENKKPSMVYNDIERDPSTQRFATEGQVKEIKRMAKNACLCERNGQGSKGECWSDFWTIVNEVKHDSGWASACAAGSDGGFWVELDPSLASKKKIDTTITTLWPYDACSADEVPAKKAEYEERTNSRGC